MNDPHVESLTYRLVTDETLIFRNPPALHHATPRFDVLLENSRLTVTMKEHHPSAESAGQVVDPFLRSWELDFALSQGIREMRFEYVSAKIVDLDPPPPGSPQVIAATGIAKARASAHGTAVVSRRDYLPPPGHFVASPEVQLLWNRFEGAGPARGIRWRRATGVRKGHAR